MGYVVDTILLGMAGAVIVIAGAFALLVRRHVGRADAREFGRSDTGGAAIVSGTGGGAHGARYGGDGGSGGD